MKKFLLLALLIASTSLYASDFNGGKWGVGGLYNSFNGVTGADGGALRVGYYADMYDVSLLLSNRSYTATATNGTGYGIQAKIKKEIGSNNYLTAGAIYRTTSVVSGSKPSMYGVSVGVQSVVSNKILLGADIYPYFGSSNSYSLGTTASTSQIFEVVQASVSYLF